MCSTSYSCPWPGADGIFSLVESCFTLRVIVSKLRRKSNKELAKNIPCMGGFADKARADIVARVWCSLLAEKTKINQNGQVPELRLCYGHGLGIAGLSATVA